MRLSELIKQTPFLYKGKPTKILSHFYEEPYVFSIDDVKYYAKSFVLTFECEGKTINLVSCYPNPDKLNLEDYENAPETTKS